MKRLTFLLAFLTIGLASCDKCKDVDCINGGTCSEGECTCPTGYSGELCQVVDECLVNQVECLNDGVCVDGTCDCGDWYTGEDCSVSVLEEKESIYAGNYSCGSSNPYIFKFTVAPAEDNVMVIEDLSVWNLDRKFEATFSNEDDFTIENQNVAGYGNEVLQAEGTGAFTSTGLQMTIQFNNVTAGTQTTNCVFVEN